MSYENYGWNSPSVGQYNRDIDELNRLREIAPLTKLEVESGQYEPYPVSGGNVTTMADLGRAETAPTKQVPSKGGMLGGGGLPDYSSLAMSGLTPPPLPDAAGGIASLMNLAMKRDERNDPFLQTQQGGLMNYLNTLGRG